MTLAPLDHIRQDRQAAAAAAHDLSRQVAALVPAIEERLSDAGAALVPQRALWAVPGELKASLQRADALVAQMAAIDARRGDLIARRGSGILARLADWRLNRSLIVTREAARRELCSVLIQVARRALTAGAGSPDARPTLDQVRRLDAELAEARHLADVCVQQVTALAREIRVREESQRQMGFDALYAAAYLKRFGPAPVASPLQLEAGELALISMPCTLARSATRTQYAGARSDFRFPVAHTGIRYRIGSRRGRPIAQQKLRRLDTGTLVVSTQRLAFIGEIKSVVVQLKKMTHVDVYDDALGVFLEGRKTPDFFFVSAPNQVGFYLNWVLQHEPAG